MKTKILVAVAMVGVLLSTMSCDKDYLETDPGNSTSPDVVFETTENAKMAVNGLAKLMTRQYLGTQGYNGEGTIKLYYGEYQGDGLVVNLPGWANVINSLYQNNPNNMYTYYPWFYYYKIIDNANAILENVDDAQGPDSEKKVIKAQALSYRAYSYTMLSQIYGNRWQDSKEGETLALVLRTKSGFENLPLSSLGQVFDQVYKDLNQALQFFEETSYVRKQNYEIDHSVTQAIFARAALIKQDYATAEKYAQLARKNYPLMTVSEYKSGFSNPNREWIWSSYGSLEETLYYYSYFAEIGYNSSASQVRSYPKRISKVFFETLSETDIRRDLFLDPQEDAYEESTGKAKTELDQRARTMFPELKSDALVFAHMQFKIAANEMPGVGHLNHFRSSEMLLIEAEAKYFQNKPTAEVALLLEELNRDSGRDTAYQCTATGQALFEEIRKYRALELWGEGFNWFDLKRWNVTLERKSYKDGGNYLPVLAITLTPESANRWTAITPAKETDHNDLIN